MYHIRIFLSIVLVALCLIPAKGEQAGRLSLTGKVVDALKGTTIEYASVVIEALDRGTSSDAQGNFAIYGLAQGEYQVSAQYLGYVPFTATVQLNGNTSLNIALKEQSFSLSEVTVMAQYVHKDASTATVTQAALEYIQPSSLGDIFQLLPGHLSTDGNMNAANQVTVRQAGSDSNTALGTAIISNGAPVSNDANLMNLPGSIGDKTITDRSSANGGIDLRMLSTDHLEEVEVVQGISSVKYGDLTSGAVILKSKSGVSPWNIRVKADPLNKLAYVGKGFRLGGKAGTLHLGFDLTQAKPDVREQLEKYTRYSFAANYANTATVWGKMLHYSAAFSYIGTLESQKNDPDLTPLNDTYSSSYNRMMLTLNGSWQVNTAVLSTLEMTVSGDYASDVVHRDKTVTPNGPVPLPLSDKEGESEGMYTPSEYLSSFRVDGKPFNFYAQLSATSLFEIAKSDHRLLWGVESRVNKNFGEGTVYDPTRPPYPTSSYSSRPRAYNSIPAMVKTAFFIEDKISARLGEHTLGLTLGVRLTNLSNLPSGYSLKGRWPAEPRVSLVWSLPGFTVGRNASVVTLRAGYGEQAKFPTLDYLYPDKAYFDVMSLNYYSQTPENRLLWVTTAIKDAANPALEVNRNRKVEIGADWSIGKFRVSATAFYEQSNSGFTYDTQYFPLAYTKYTDLKNPVMGKPSVADFNSVADTLLYAYGTARNAVRTVKKGIEYRISIPQIRAIRTQIEINGAYYNTLYDNSLPSQKRPSSTIGGKPYPYVGIYNWNQSRYSDQFNTNIWLNTHIPKFRLYFSTMIQAVWRTSSRSKQFSGIPTAYLSADGKVRPFAQEQINDPRYSDLVMSFTDAYFQPNVSPVSLSLNLKASKEIGQMLRVSFFVNRLWDFNPLYQTNLSTQQRKWVVPFFGAELQLKI